MISSIWFQTVSVISAVVRPAGCSAGVGNYYKAMATKINMTIAHADRETTAATTVMTKATTTSVIPGVAAGEVSSISTLATSERTGMGRILRQRVEPAMATQR